MANAPVPPHDLDAEETLLGAILLSDRAIDAALDAQVQPGDFYRASSGVAYAAACALHAAGEPVDAVTLPAELERSGQLQAAGGRARIHELAVSAPAAGNAGHYARIVRDLAALRALAAVGHEIQASAYERGAPTAELIDRAERAVFDLAVRGGGDGFVPAATAAHDAYRRLEELAAAGRDIVGLPTGFRLLDKLTSGLHPGQLAILAARPSMGKTALALNIAANTVLRHEPPLPVALFTFEMSRGEVMNRLFASEGLVDLDRVVTPSKLGREDWERITHASGRLHQAPLLIDDRGPATGAAVRSKARRLKAQQPDLALVVLDYVQLMTSGDQAENRTQEVAQLSRGLKALAVELQVPVLALSQLSRDVERRHDKRPLLSDLRESGALEQDADLVALLYREEYYFPDEIETRGIAEINLAKHRNGPVAMRKLAFVDRHARFSDLEL